MAAPAACWSAPGGLNYTSMPVTSTDLRFFTNAPDETLYDRFVATLKDVQYFDLLVGYFRTSGFQRLARELGETEKIRILVGLSIDQQVK